MTTLGQTNKYNDTIMDDRSGWRHPILIHSPIQVDLTMVKRWIRWNTLAFFAMCEDNYFLASLFGSTPMMPVLIIIIYK